MAQPAVKLPRYTYEEYLEMEDRAEERHIFWDGEIYAMAGASLKHSVLESRLVRLLGNVLDGRPCHALVGNQHLRALDSERTVYADASIVSGRFVMHPESSSALTNPTVVFEILSDSTEAFDRGDKFAYYRSFESIRSVVLLSQKTRRVERYSRDERGLWRLEDLGPDDTLRLPEVEVNLPIAEIYEGTEGLDIAS